MVPIPSELVDSLPKATHIRGKFSDMMDSKSRVEHNIKQKARLDRSIQDINDKTKKVKAHTALI